VTHTSSCQVRHVCGSCASGDGPVAAGEPISHVGILKLERTIGHPETGQPGNKSANAHADSQRDRADNSSESYPIIYIDTFVVPRGVT
jgi:hypothetical protein